ncbi:unnamed protein product [Durusdinium trenchii]|uniref:Amidohydrolase-related domain-containing protein n=1 Tax=Durusdinium trenchii TaxID=1381693 RepID=A0ABP0P490_9DINO
MELLMDGVIDTHIHLSEHYKGGLPNSWHPKVDSPGFQRDWSLEDFRASTKRGAGGASRFGVVGAIFVECFNEGPLEEAQWVLDLMQKDPFLLGLVAQIRVQQGPEHVKAFLEKIRLPSGELPKGLKGARFVFMACENQADDACLDPVFLEGLQVLSDAQLLWEFCCEPRMALHLPSCIKRFPKMTFVIDHLAHNGSKGGDMDTWSPAIDALGQLPNVYMKMGATEQWEVEDPGAYMDRAIKAFGFDRILYESNWFVNEAMGDAYDRTATLLYEACQRAGASDLDLVKVFRGNACHVYQLDL